MTAEHLISAMSAFHIDQDEDLKKKLLATSWTDEDIYVIEAENVVRLLRDSLLRIGAG